MAAEAINNPNSEEVFVYMGGDMVVPQDVVRVRVHPSVTVIPDDAFTIDSDDDAFDETESILEEVELCEGLLDIGKRAFFCCVSLKRIKIPSTVTVIHKSAFGWCLGLEEVELSEGLQEIGMCAFSYCSSL